MSAPPYRILILMSDTGGGHRSAAEAIASALERQFPGRYDVQLADGITRAAMFPFNHMPEWYLPAVTYGEFWWGVLFHTTNRPLLVRLTWALFRRFAGRGLRRILQEAQPDLVVSVHPLLTTVPRQLLRSLGSRAPFVVVVTDLTDGHGLWFDPGADLTLVPTDSAKEAARRWCVPAGQVRVVGLPVSLKFLSHDRGKVEERTQLGLDPSSTTVLLVGGGEGMGPVYEIARAIDAARLPIQLVVIAGRNAALHKRLKAAAWHIPVVVEGFVTNMPDWMRASDVLITKAGPGTISEGLACGLPILLSGFLPGQEEGNVTFTEQSGAGILCRDPAEIGQVLGKWLEPDTDTLSRLAARARQLARPRAALDIAAILDGILNARQSRL